MSSKSRVCLVLASAFTALPMLTGCTAGYVYDSSTKQALPGVTVQAEATCQGSGCKTPTYPIATTGSTGIFDFDGYGNENGTNDVQQLSTFSGLQNEGITFSKSGYQSLQIFHTQSFKPYQSNGNTYQVDMVNPTYLCPNGAKDTDGDSLCDTAEASYGTNPNLADSDGDGIDDRTELFGTWAGYVNGNQHGVDLTYMGANPNHKDIYVYYNYYTAPIQAGLQQVVTAFANAPVSNPDGTTGITLHLYGGIQIAAADQVSNFLNVGNGDWSQFDVIKNKYFPAQFATFMHYAVFANLQGTSGSSGIARGIPGHDFLITLGAFTGGVGTQQQQAGTFMHEFGHTMGLQHGGNEGNNCKPNYLSIMNYMYQQNGLQTTAASGILDYSRFVVEAVNEGALIETNGMKVDSTAGSVTASTYAVRVGDTTGKGCASSGVSHIVKGALASSSIDWNNNGTYQTASEALDLDGDTSNLTNKTFRASQNDWASLIYTGSTIGGGTISGTEPISSKPKLLAEHARPQIVAPADMPAELTP